MKGVNYLLVCMLVEVILFNNIIDKYLVMAVYTKCYTWKTFLSVHARCCLDGNLIKYDRYSINALT